MALIYNTAHEQFYIFNSSQCEVLDQDQKDGVSFVMAIRNDKFKGVKFLSVKNNEKPWVEQEIELDMDSEPVKIVKANQNSLVVCTKSGRMFLIN